MLKKISEFNEAQRLELGKRVHEKMYGSTSEAAQKLNVSRTTVFECLRLYRLSIGHVSPQSERASKPRAKPTRTPKANGNGSALVHVPDNEIQVTKLQTENEKLRGELERALNECHTLQKLLMTVGTTL